jgi:hypothetical protein
MVAKGATRLNLAPARFSFAAAAAARELRWMTFPVPVPTTSNFKKNGHSFDY